MVGDQQWSAERRPGGWAGVVVDGQAPPSPAAPVIIFLAPDGARRILTLIPGAPPTDLNTLSTESLIALLAQAV